MLRLLTLPVGGGAKGLLKIRVLAIDSAVAAINPGAFEGCDPANK
jgi:hypothetical protein